PSSLFPEPRPPGRAPGNDNNKDRAARTSWGSGHSSTGYRSGYRWTFARWSSIVVWHCGLGMEPEPEERARCTTRQGRCRQENAPLEATSSTISGFSLDFGGPAGRFLG